MSESTTVDQVDAARSSLQTAIEVLTTYGEGIHQSIKQGTAFSDVSTKTTQAAEYVTELGTRLKSAKTFGDLPVDTVGDLVGKALTSLSAVADHAAEFDRKYALSQQLYGTLEGAITQARESLNDVKEKVDATRTQIADKAASATTAAQEVATKVTGTVTSAASTIAAQEPVQRAHVALQELVTKLQTTVTPAEGGAASDALTKAKEMIHGATEEVGKSIVHLKDAPLSEMPVVAALEALALARTALHAVTSALGTVYETSGVATAITAARERAGSAVTDATTQLTTIRGRFTSGAVTFATDVANAGVDFAVRHAAAIDQSYSITDRVRSLNESYGVAEKVAAATATVQSLAVELDKSYGVSDKALGAIERAKQLDSSITGGRGTSLTTAAIQAGTTLAAAATDYAKTIVNKFEEAKVDRQSPTANESNATSTTQADTKKVVS